MSTKNSNQPPVNIVIIDDDAETVELLNIILKRHGYRTTHAASATTGMHLLEEIRPELLLMDFILPDMDGLSALKAIREKFPETYVVIFTGRGGEEAAVEAMKGGASEYLLKPFNNRSLVQRIEALLRLREIELANRALQTERENLLLEIEAWNRELQLRVREKSNALQKTQAEIAQTEKIAALGYLSAGMAHEIRNPLNSISLFTQLLKQSINDEELLEYLEGTAREVERIEGIIRGLVDAANRSRSIIKDVMLDQIIRSALEIFSPQIEAKRTTVILECPESPPPIKADPTEMEQIFTNLFTNALEEMQKGGILRINLSSDADQIVVRVTDSGKGIKPELLEKIFEPFFTTKKRGTGIGLPVIRRIARQYRGNVTVEQSSPAGTTFRVDFPVNQI